jgi:thermostable 8-oxoguanine DNA glycosylase
MITADDIRHLRTESDDYKETEALKAELRKLRDERSPFFLTGEELYRVFRWKLRSQYARVARHLARNSDAEYRAVTKKVFAVVSDEFKEECTARLRLLVDLHGVGVPVASAVLALSDPERYCVIDFRGWWAVFGEERKSFSISHYVKYRTEVARIAADLGWPVQEADLAIWEFDRRRSKRLP